LNEAIGVLVMAEQYEPALQVLDRVRSMRAETPGDLYYRALIYDKLHQPKPALAAYRQFLENSNGKYPDQEFIARQRARVLQREAAK
jgi:regulator of sirC expression with transglutaminase-like and TPR domain